MAILALQLRFFWPNLLSFVDFSICTSATASVEHCSPHGEVPWSIVVVNRRVLTLSRAMTGTVSVLNVWGFCMHARWFTGYQNVHFVKISISEPSTLGLRFLKRSHPFFSVAASAAPYESATWSSDVELEAMESEQTGLAFSLPLSPEHVRVNSPVEFAHDYLYPSPEARDTVSFGLDDVLLTAASDSEDFGPALADAFPPGLLRPTPSSWTCFPAPLRSSRWIGPMSPASLSLRNSTSDSLVARNPGLKGGSYHFSVICITRSPDPGNSLFPPVLLTWQPLTSPTWWVLWSRAILPFRWSRTLPPFTFLGAFLEVSSPPSD